MKVLKWIIIVLLVLTLVGGIIYYVITQKSTQNQKADDDFYASYTDSSGKVHEIKVVRQAGTITGILNSFADFDAPDFVAGTFPLTQLVDDGKLTATTRSYWAKFVTDVLVKNYDEFIVHAKELTGVPRCMIYAVILSEIDPKKLEKSISLAGARGPGQIKKITATDTLVVAKRLKNFKPEHEEILAKTIGQPRTAVVMKAVNTYDRSVVEIGKTGTIAQQNELNNPELNIHIIALKLANLLDVYGAEDLPSVFYSYNQGDATAKVREKINGKGIDYALKNTSGEGRKYIIRLLGLNGAMDIVTNTVGITD
jgi:hypothetical protein